MSDMQALLMRQQNHRPPHHSITIQLLHVEASSAQRRAARLIRNSGSIQNWRGRPVAGYKIAWPCSPLPRSCSCPFRGPGSAAGGTSGLPARYPPLTTACCWSCSSPVRTMTKNQALSDMQSLPCQDMHSIEPTTCHEKTERKQSTSSRTDLNNTVSCKKTKCARLFKTGKQM